MTAYRFPDSTRCRGARQITPRPDLPPPPIQAILPGMSDLTELKRLAAQRALAEVQDGMRLGLGTGSTAAIFIDLLGQRLRAGDLQHIAAVATSQASAARAAAWGIPAISLAAAGRLHLAVDGADEIDAALNLIKGLGHALLREKIVAIHAERFLVIADEGKRSPRLGVRSPLPVEITPFAADATVNWLNTLGCRAELWRDAQGQPFCTDNGNLLARCWFAAGITDPYALARALADRPGVVEHGLFLDMANAVILAGGDGLTLLERQR